MSEFLEENTQAEPTEEGPKLGAVTWFEGDVNFSTVVQQLQAMGQLPKSPYNMPMPYLSVSQCEMYLKCPQQYYRRYVLGEKRPPSVALVQGTTIHKVVEEGYKDVMAALTHPLEKALDIYSGELDKNLTEDVVWDDTNDDDDLLVGPKKDKGAVKDQGVQLVKAWHKVKLPNVKPTAVEKSFVTFFGGSPVVGKVDLIDAQGEMTVVDNKVVGKKYAQSLVNNKLQLSLYSHATQLPRQRLDLFIKSKVPRLDELITSRDAQSIRWAARIFESVAKAISAGVFTETSPESFLCNPKWCGYWATCRGAI